MAGKSSLEEENISQGLNLYLQFSYMMSGIQSKNYQICHLSVQMCYTRCLWPWLTIKKLKIELLYDPDISIQGIYLKEMKTVTQKGICNPMSIAVLFE